MTNNKSAIPRGLRNNNPLNIRKTNNPWLGKIKDGTDPAFEQFVSMDYGIRAAFINCRTIIKRTKSCTVEKLIKIWAPPSENNTIVYIHRVCETAGFIPQERLEFRNKSQMCKLLHAMTIVECGQPLSMTIFEQAYDMV